MSDKNKDLVEAIRNEPTQLLLGARAILKIMSFVVAVICIMSAIGVVMSNAGFWWYLAEIGLWVVCANYAVDIDYIVSEIQAELIRRKETV